MLIFRAGERGWFGGLVRSAFAALALLIAAGFSVGQDRPSTLETRTLTAEEAEAVLRHDWQFQADNAPTLSRIRYKIQ